MRCPPWTGSDAFAGRDTRSPQTFSSHSCTWVKRWISWGNKGRTNLFHIATTPLNACNLHLLTCAMLTAQFPLQLCPPQSTHCMGCSWLTGFNPPSVRGCLSPDIISVRFCLFHTVLQAVLSSAPAQATCTEGGWRDAGHKSLRRTCPLRGDVTNPCTKAPQGCVSCFHLVKAEHF